jgi:DNA replication and repair protein RecF
MIVARLRLRGFRSYARAELELGPGLTVVTGHNGAGKTNLLEGLYFACTGRSFRTANEREVVHFGAGVARLEAETSGPDGRHVIAVGFEPGQPKRLTVDGTPVERLSDINERPLVSVFAPDRLELVLGAPTLRRAHLDQVIAARWPVRSPTRRRYAAALAQRNALLSAIRSGRAARDSLPAWDAELARHGMQLMGDRRRLVEALRPRFADLGDQLGLEEPGDLAYRPRSRAAVAEELAAELAARVDGDLERGFTGHGPHRDELVLLRGDRDLKTYGSRGQQRLGLLALLLAEREELGEAHGRAPLMLLDDVMSELDGRRRARLAELLLEGGQSVISATEPAHVPGADRAEVTRVRIVPGAVQQELPVP